MKCDIFVKLQGWFWSGSGAKIPDTDKIPAGWTTNPWGQTGELVLEIHQNFIWFKSERKGHNLPQIRTNPV